MTTRNPDQERYLAELTYHLRERNLPGPRIGEILAEVEAHTAASGESPHEAFGEARDYARQWTDPSRSWIVSVRSWLAQLPALLLLGLGGVLLQQGGVALIDRDVEPFGLSGGWAALIGGALFVAGAYLLVMVTADDQIIDPRTGRSRSTGRRGRVLVLLSIGTVALAMGLLLGALL